MRAVVILAVCLAVSGSARADFQAGLQAWEKGDYRVAFEQFKPDAEAGDAKAQFYLAEAFSLGRGTVQDYAEALNWYRKAAEQSHPEAMEKLCGAYFFGENIIRKDEAQAAVMCAGAAKAGKVYPAFLAAYSYEYAKGVTEDLTKAVEFYKIAADGGNLDAQEALGRMLFFGQGVSADYGEAVKWNRKAAEAGRPFAQYLLGYSYDYGRGVQQDYTEAALWYQKAADQGDARAMSGLGYLYAQGRGVPKDEAKAVELYLKAADKQEPSVYALLGWAYYQGAGAAKSNVDSANWFRKAAELNDAQSQYMLGYLLEQEKNFTEAAQWYQKAAEQGVIGAHESLAALYFSGQGVQQDYAQAAKWYQKPAENGSVYAQYLLGYIYESGKHGVTADPPQAVKWYALAAEKGDARAQLALGYLLSDDKAGKPDLVQAHMWSNLAASQLAGEERTAAERQREYIGSKLNKDQLIKAQQLARDWKPKT